MIINHLGPTMDRVIRNVKEMASYAFQTRSDKILGLSGPASAAMEMAVSNLCWPGRKVLCLSNGTFSARLGEMAIGVGAEVTFVEAAPGRPVGLAEVREAFAKQSFDVVTMAHGETSCGVKMFDLRRSVSSPRSTARHIVDSVVTLTAMPCTWIMGHRRRRLRGQKALSSIPAVAVARSPKMPGARSRPTRSRAALCYDALRAQKVWGRPAVPLHRAGACVWRSTRRCGWSPRRRSSGAFAATR